MTASTEPTDHRTEQLEALLAVERAERQRLQKILALRDGAQDAASSFFMILHSSAASGWRIVYANRALALAHGYEPEELTGRSPTMLLRMDLNQEAFERISEAVTELRAVSVELVAQRRDGSTFWLGLFIAPIREAGDAPITHYVSVGADITARLAQERAQRELQERLYTEMQERERIAIELRLAQKLESVGRLAAGIAHEINTPIQYIGDSVSFLQSAQSDLERLLKGYSTAFQDLSDRAVPESLLHRVKVIEQSVDLPFLRTEIPKAFERALQGIQRVAAIVRAMKEFAHPGSNEQTPADLNHALEVTLTVAHSEYKYSARIETAFGELPPVMCNVGELNQVFLNLIVNAAHAIGESGKDAAEGKITITTALVGDHVVISVADNGCGIPGENLERVFDPFFTTKPVGRGTGQGLAIARSIVVEKHGGHIDVESVVGRGTRFVLRLPVAGRPAEHGAS